MAHRKDTVCWMLGAALLAGCTATDVCACSPNPPTGASIHGSVRTADDVAAEGAAVAAYSAEGAGCTSMETDYGMLLSDSGGHFSVVLPGDREQADACVYVYAHPPQGMVGLDGSDTTLVVVDFRDGDPGESAQVVLVLRPK